MEDLKYSKIISKNWEIIALVTGVTIVLALIITLIQPFQFSATTKILIIQKQEKNLDAYTATKSAERIGKNLVNVVYTSIFYNEVIESNPDIANNFPADSVKRRKMWAKNVKANVIPETGILEIVVYDVDRKYAAELVKNISYVLVNKGSNYHGGGTGVEIKIVDDVFISKYPVRPNVLVNLAIAIILGVLLGSAYAVLNESRQPKDAKISQPAKALPARPYQRPAMVRSESKGGFSDRLNKTKIITMHDHLS